MNQNILGELQSHGHSNYNARTLVGQLISETHLYEFKHH